MKALLVYPTHKNCDEVRDKFRDAGIYAECYPPRSLKDTEHFLQNCWNPIAEEAERIGLPVVKAVCSDCPERSRCVKDGYLAQLAAADAATVALCTHKRAEFSGFHDLVNGREYVSVHENAMNILRPLAALTLSDLEQVKIVVDWILNDPVFLDWFGDNVRTDNQGRTYCSEELGIRKDRQLKFFRHLSNVVDNLLDRLLHATSNEEWKWPEPQPRPVGVERTLFRATGISGAEFEGQPFRLVLAAASGELVSAAILVSKHPIKGQSNAFHVIRKVIGCRHNVPSAANVTWFSDATLAVDRLESILGHEVVNRTPDGRLELRKKAIQIPRDLTRRTSPRIAMNILRGVMADRPQFQRIGIIGHQTHIAAIRLLEPEFRKRIVKQTYFGSGEDRSSNAWHPVCKVIIVAGTPRLPPSAISSYLVQVGDVGAACRRPEWGPLYWEGVTESGAPVSIKSSGYRDEAWRRAHRDLVRAAMVQAIGRGRGILETGCEVIVLSNEECGLVISDAGLDLLNASAVRVLAALEKLTMENANKGILANSIVSTSRISNETNLSPVRVRELLRMLERRGQVCKVGERGGWRLVTCDDSEPNSPAETVCTTLTEVEPTGTLQTDTSA